MALGNGNPKDGDKGSNFNYELKVLQSLEQIANFFSGGPGPSPIPAFDAACFTPKITSQEILNPPTITLLSAFYTKVKNIVQCNIIFNYSSSTLNLLDTLDITDLPYETAGGFSNATLFYSIVQSGNNVFNLAPKKLIVSATPSVINIYIEKTIGIDGEWSLTFTYPADAC
jgi:hypothetical protein